MNANEKMKNYLEQLEQRVKVERLSLALLPDLGEIDAYLSDICFQAFIPFNLDAEHEIQFLLERAGWKVVSRYNRDWAGDAVIEFEHPSAGRRFSVVMEPEKEGSTCRKQIVSYNQTPVYEIVCNGAEASDGTS